MPDNDNMLDNPVWWSLSTHHRPRATGTRGALTIAKDFGPFAALSGDDPKTIDAFLNLVAQREAPAYTMQHWSPFGNEVAPTAMGVQMVAHSVANPTDHHEIVDLREVDAVQMFNLARQARPGPFECRTHELGDFIGVKEGGRLIAMAGQRLSFPGFTEISAVCVAEDCRSRGLGAALVLEMTARILASGNQPFLHTFASNQGAIALYKRLGFRIRADVQVTLWDAAKISEARRYLQGSEMRLAS
ncbi:GNAT family N-acetyltransferase [Cognatiyoonia sp. IB215446]|uniref:GNAT family N-acetyltransferase n=1 Tax=Cognatiyoonia sp. IB215446 TaxID=3097355 RepID=UPI002A0BE5BF|nr:GNAT family N-acetyltransferase [Cognatiyoonia sp. IB215446]MDX8346956.1 GNAT family N-acetyltransferase [Cognatiyoonia sp. IB215446]